MGAMTFTSHGSGASMEEAFSAAVKQAQYDYGHAGYTGTIAEKPGCVLVEQEPMSEDEAHAKAAELIERSDARIDDKWGNAGAIRLDEDHPNGEQRYLFFGWASS